MALGQFGVTIWVVGTHSSSPGAEFMGVMSVLGRNDVESWVLGRLQVESSKHGASSKVCFPVGQGTYTGKYEEDEMLMERR